MAFSFTLDAKSCVEVKIHEAGWIPPLFWRRVKSEPPTAAAPTLQTSWELFTRKTYQAADSSA